MIQVNELRIGNLVFRDELNIENGKWDELAIKINYQDIFNLINGNDMVKTAYNPIPLTEEWLVKFGFDSFSECGRKTGTFGHLKINGIYFDLNNKKLIFIDKGWSQSVCFEKSIEYAHELQNIIFAITGKELTIN